MIIPRATYRLQFNEGFRLRDARALVPYLRALGISHLYASPLFKACPHSQHGYDVCDFSRLNPEIGTEDELGQLMEALRENGMGFVLDIVPNHMGIISPENPWWWDVLKNGRASRFAGYFDINWNSSDEQLRGKVLLPVLGDDYERVLKKGELQVEETDAGFGLRYYENHFPLAPNSLSKTLLVEEINSRPEALDELVQLQNYRLAPWQTGDQRLNYRRFFAVSTLAGVRVEYRDVFAGVHVLLQRWLGKNWLDGLRVDHPDGLRDPEDYLRRLRELAPEQWIVVEKILQPGESLPATWPVHGTTGYDFLNQLNGLFVNPAAEKVLTDFYVQFTGEPAAAGPVIREKKRLVLQTLFTAEVNRLTELLFQIAVCRLPGNVFTRDDLREALMDWIAGFPVYRTYIRPEKNFVEESDRYFIEEARDQVLAANPQLAPELSDLISGLLSLRLRGELEQEWISRFQQLSGAVMAKGVEDTAFYCLNRFVSLNEVGGDPGTFGVTPAEFHAFCQRQQAQWPQTMLASSTHDTKRSEDVRARLNVLSEIPDQWCAAVGRWSKMNDPYRRGNFPDRNAEYLFYQTLVGAWPLSAERLAAYWEKAAREAKQHTGWNQPAAEYERALKEFAAGALADRHFVDDLEQFILRLRDAAHINSLAQTLVKLTAPGVPDTYQGTEILDYSLVDPDNRRPVDFSRRQQMLAEAKNLSAGESWSRRATGLAKLWLIQKTLAVRTRHEETFRQAYTPLAADGPKTNHIVAFMRGDQMQRMITVAPRFTLQLSPGWENTTLKLPPGNWHNELTGQPVTVTAAGEILISELLKSFPVALLAERRN
jgi:(1->4)-alpha-D-glucan 1-alpha-D-glucosylmutase